MAGEGPGSVGTRSVGRRLGDYELLEELGRGGMGVVYKARQISMDRLVALKVMPAFAGLDATAVARFRREAEAAGRLAHPGVVPVYACGEFDGVHFFAMGLVEGPSLAQMLDRLSLRRPEKLREALPIEAECEDRWPRLEQTAGEGEGNAYVRSCVAIAADVANALAAAHTARIIHRDLKPGNVIIQYNGYPVVVDFGLARDELAAGLTLSQDTLGTPSYMSPEQVRGSRALDPRADIYGLGATLYELLTLRPPFEGTSAADILRKIEAEEPLPVRKRNARVPLDLETIVHKCLAKKAEDRYPAIEALEVDLRSFLLGRQIMARRPSLAERCAQLFRRSRKTTLVIAVTLLCAVAFMVAWVFADTREKQREGQRALAFAGAELLESASLIGALAFYARAEVLLGDLDAVRAARVRHVRAAFERHYPARLGFLRQLVAALETGERARLGSLVDKLAGRGTFRFDGVTSEKLTTITVEIRGFRDDRFDHRWRSMPPRRKLPIGEYLARITRPDHVTRVQRVVVERDRETVIDVRLLPANAMPEGMVQVTDPDSAWRSAVATTELTRGRYRQFLTSLTDPLLRAEMEPQGWRRREGAHPGLPVRGLSFAQARAAAAHLGGHLPSLTEFRLAASGGLVDLSYPWSGGFRADRLAADPDRLQGPVDVREMTAGASPLGVLHLLGNVGELLSTTAEGSVLMAGGHFHSLDPASLKLTDTGALVEEVRTANTPSRFAGLRLARFLPPFADRAAGEAARAALSGVLKQRGGSIYHDWRIGGDGTVAYALMLTGFHAGGEERELEFATGGFVQLPGVRLVDGHGRKIDARFRLSSSRESSTVRVATVSRRGARYRWRLAADLLPTSGLRADGDNYVFRVPIKAATGVPVVYRIRLPATARITAVSPEPTHRVHDEGGWCLDWHLQPEGRYFVLPVMVRFRVDGMLTRKWPSRERTERFVLDFLRTLSSGDHERLRRLLHPAYLELPSGLDHAARTSEVSAITRLSAPWFRDVTAVGPVTTVELLADWTVGGSASGAKTLRDWPVQVQILRTGSEFRVVRLGPSSRTDTGRLEGEYTHDRLKVKIGRAAGTVLTRLGDALTEMQVMYVHPDDANVRMQVLGHYIRDDESEDGVKLRLSSGAARLRPAEVLTGRERHGIGPEDARVEGESTHWVFGGRGHWTRERWTFAHRGRRWFLLKTIAHGASRGEALHRHQASMSWFDAMSATVVIE